MSKINTVKSGRGQKGQITSIEEEEQSELQPRVKPIGVNINQSFGDRSQDENDRRNNSLCALSRSDRWKVTGMHNTSNIKIISKIDLTSQSLDKGDRKMFTAGSSGMLLRDLK